MVDQTENTPKKKSLMKKLIKKIASKHKDKETSAEQKTDTHGEIGAGETTPSKKYSFLGKK